MSPSAAEFFENAQAPLQRKLDRCFDLLELDPRRHPNIKPLKGKWDGCHRFRVGDYRVVYRIDDEKMEVTVRIIAHRSKVYE